MRRRRYNQSLGNCVWLAIPILVGSHTFLAEAVKPSPATAIAVMMQSPDPQNATISTMASERCKVTCLWLTVTMSLLLRPIDEAHFDRPPPGTRLRLGYEHLFALEEAQ